MSVLLDNGDGTFQAAPAFAAGSGPRSVAVGDFNRDGIRDLTVANFDSTTVSVLRGTGNGAFGAAQVFAAGSGPISVAVGDLDRDGIEDLVAANYGTTSVAGLTVSVLRGNADGTFGAAVPLGVGERPIFVAIGDFNRDGSPDLAAANNVSNTVSVLLGNGNGHVPVGPEPRRRYRVRSRSPWATSTAT